MIERRLKPALDRLLERNPAVVLIGPRQVGKTTLAREIARERDAVYVDLELPSDLAKGFHSACEDLRPARRFVVPRRQRELPALEGRPGSDRARDDGPDRPVRFPLTC